MRLVLVAICLLLVTPIAGSFWYVYTLVYPISNCTLFILDLTIKSRERGGGGRYFFVNCERLFTSIRESRIL